MGTFKINGELELNSYLTAATTLYVSSADNTSIIFKHGSTECLRINPSGCLNIGSTQTANTYKLYVAGKTWLSDTLYFNSTASYINASDYTGNAATATKLATARTISLTGSVTGSGSFDGSGNLSIATTTNHTHSYLPLSGGTLTGKLQVNAPIFGYNYSSGGNNVASFIWDKPGSNYTGMGACAEADTIYFGACNIDGVWVTDYRQKWKFNGSLIVGGGDNNCNIVPWTNNYSTIGTESLKWWKIYASTFIGDLTGNAATATKLANSRTIRTNLGSTSTASFNGTANITPGVTGTLPIANGGTGATTAAGARSNLELGAVKLDYVIDLSGYSASNYYFVDLSCNDLELDCEIHSPNVGGADAYNQNVVHFLMIYQGWSDTPQSFIMLHQGSYDPSELTIMSIVAGTRSGLRGVYLRGSRKYRFRSNFAPTLHTSQYSFGDEVYPSGGTSMACTNATTVWTNNGSKRAYWSVPLYGAVWNDYAEYRDQQETVKPGHCVASADNGKVYKTTEKFQACDGIVSDTFGFAIGETDECKTPLAVAGRVLAYCEGDRNDYSAGDTVCAGPNGKVVKMTREEIREWPDRIVGIVSEIPEYETWGSGNIAVNGRIWIKVK